MQKPDAKVSFFTRMRMAVACLTRRDFARKIKGIFEAGSAPAAAKPAEPPERVHASGLAMLAMLQREGRLIDFLQEEVAPFSDAEIGAAARVVHAGCRKALEQCLELEPVLGEAEGERVTVPDGFDAHRIRLAGAVAGQPPFQGTLKHHGWVTKEVRLPTTSEALDPRVLAPAEVEI